MVGVDAKTLKDISYIGTLPMVAFQGFSGFPVFSQGLPGLWFGEPKLAGMEVVDGQLTLPMNVWMQTTDLRPPAVRTTDSDDMI